MASPDLETDLLRAFVAVAQTGSFTAAAEMVGRSQSAISKRIARIEELLQRRIFTRTSRWLALTHEGERLLVTARRILALNDAFLHELHGPDAANLRIGLSDNLVSTHLTRLLSRFAELHPRVHLDLTTGMSGELRTAYAEGQLDVVITKRAHNSASLSGRVLWREPLVWLAAADYEVDVDWRQPVRLLMQRPPCAYRQEMIEALDAIDRPWVSAFTTSNLPALQSALAAGMGVTALGKSFVQDGVRILRTSEHWPALPMSEIVVIGEESAAADLSRPLLSFLVEGLVGSGSLVGA